jgi:hypothetical protein
MTDDKQRQNAGDGTVEEKPQTPPNPQVAQNHTPTASQSGQRPAQGRKPLFRN